jgi:hypothetical protein
MRFRHIVSIPLVTFFLLQGSGVAEYLHNLQHAREDAIEDAAFKVDGKQAPAHQHDENNCFVHAQLHIPTIATAWVPLLVFLGVLVAFLTQIATPLVSRRALVRIDCRGPPVC